MNLIVDAGNTATKLAVFRGNAMIMHKTVARADFLGEIKKIFLQYAIQQAIFSSVLERDSREWEELFQRCPTHRLSANSVVPFSSSYESPSTLGIDRIALAAAAAVQYPAQNVLVIDMGTCITYDLLTHNGLFLGGGISPGVQMRYRAMHNQTAKLPLLEPSNTIDLVGNSTQSAMHSGVLIGILAEVDGIIERYKERFQDLTVILTGGDSHFFVKRLKNSIFANSKFLLEGLNSLLEYNKP